MPNTVTYKGHTDPARTEYIAATAGGMQFPRGVKVEDVPDEVVQELEAMTDHEFEINGKATGYDAMSVEDLQAEADSRSLGVEGTGANGNVLKKDLVAALEGDDSSS